MSIYLECGEFFIIINKFSFYIHFHIGNFDKQLHVCRYGVMIE